MKYSTQVDGAGQAAGLERGVADADLQDRVAPGNRHNNQYPVFSMFLQGCTVLVFTPTTKCFYYQFPKSCNTLPYSPGDPMTKIYASGGGQWGRNS